jgi:hypothetical protein
MKKCSQCGKECPDEAIQRPSDRSVLAESLMGDVVKTMGVKESRRMKMFMWFFMVMLLAASSGCWEISSIFKTCVFSGYGSDPDLPIITTWLLYPNTWLMFFPIPWLVWLIVLSVRRTLSSRQILIFSGATTIAFISIIVIVAIALKAVINWESSYREFM